MISISPFTRCPGNHHLTCSQSVPSGNPTPPGPPTAPAQPLTSIAHGAEDALGDTHDGVGGLVVATDGLASAGELAYVLQEVVEGLADHAGSCADLLQQLSVVGGRLAGTDTVFYWAIHKLPCFDQLLLAHGGADGGAHDLKRDGSGSWAPRHNSSLQCPLAFLPRPSLPWASVPYLEDQQSNWTVTGGFSFSTISLCDFWMPTNFHLLYCSITVDTTDYFCREKFLIFTIHTSSSWEPLNWVFQAEIKTMSKNYNFFPDIFPGSLLHGLESRVGCFSICETRLVNKESRRRETINDASNWCCKPSPRTENAGGTRLQIRACVLGCSVVSDSVILWPGIHQAPLSIHGISQARKLEWVALPFSRGSSWPGDWIHVSCTGRRILYCWAMREALTSVQYVVSSGGETNTYHLVMHYLSKDTRGWVERVSEVRPAWVASLVQALMISVAVITQ